MRLSSTVFGAHTITLGAVPVSPNQIYVPLCTKIRSWTCDQSRDLSLATQHHNIITYISQSHQHYVSADWSGIVSIYDKNWKLKYSMETPHPPVAAVRFLSETKLIVLSRGSNNFKPGAISVYNLTEESGELVQTLVDNYVQISCYRGFLYVWKWILPSFQFIKYDANLTEISSHEFLVEKGPNVGNAINETDIVLCLSNRSLIWLDNVEFAPRDSAHLQNVANSQIWAMEFVRRQELLFQRSLSEYVVMDIRTGGLLKKFQGPAHFVCFMSLLGEYLWVGTVEGVFRLDFSKCDLYSDTATQPSLTDDGAGWLTPDMTSFHYHEVACCGVDMSGNYVVSGDMGGNVFVWDASRANDVISDNVTIETDMKVLYKCASKTDGIRCITCLEHDDTLVVFIGTYSGALLCWIPGAARDITSSARVNDVTTPVSLVRVQDTITCVRVFGSRLCFSTVTGHIYLYQLGWDGLLNTELVVEHQPMITSNDAIVTTSPDDVTGPSERPVVPAGSFALVFEKQVHVPQTPATPDASAKFGSLALKAEIWSLSFSPCGGYIATCSEDQTVAVTDTTTREIRHVFKDHVLAVTCVKWVKYGSRSLLVSTSDDNTIVVRDMQTARKLHVLACPEDLIGFCTFTYLDVIISSSAEGDDDVTARGDDVTTRGDDVTTRDDDVTSALKVVCCTENGYLIVRDVLGGRVEYCNRVHQGSIEGLRCTGPHIVTCSSDCTVQLHTLL